MSRAKFNQLYRLLNPAQREAVDTIEGPVMVVAGPGTGKTHVLTLRIANILRLTDTSPDSILALTFTESAVHSMRARLVEIIGSAGYRVNLETFHGFCNQLIHDYPEEFPRIIGSRPANQMDQIKLLEQVITKSRVTLLRPYGEPFYHLFSVLAEIDRLKKESIDPGQLARLVSTPKERELVVLYRAYEAALRREKLYDFADMIMEVVRTLGRKPDFLLRLQEQYQYILADEHQDANQSQNQLLELLTNFHPTPNLFIVGDDKQAIFQFQGASLDNFNYFKKLHPRAKLIYLTHNYRSDQTILDSAHSLINSGPKLMAAGNKDSRPILLYPFSTLENQYRFVAADVKGKKDVAILYRDNQDAWPVAEALERAGVPFTIQSATDVLSDLELQKLLLILQAIYYFGVDNWLYRVLPLDFLGFDNLEIYRLAEWCQQHKVSAYQVLQKNRQFKSFYEFYKKLSNWQQASHNLNLTDLFGRVLEESGFITHLLKQPAAADKLAKLQTLYEEMKDLVSRHRHYHLGDFINYLQLLEKHGLSLQQKSVSSQSDRGRGVRLMTIHRAKGLEFDYVYIVDAHEGHLGGRRRRPTFHIPIRGGANEDQDSERRLFYVALTRARHQVAILYSTTGAGGKHRLPSQLVEEINKKFTKIIDSSQQEASWRRQKPVWLAPRVLARATLEEKAYLNNLFFDHGFSVTDLNNYLRCPLQYFFVNLVRLVKVQNKHLLYGTAIHQTLKEFFDAYRVKRRWPLKKLVARFKYHLEREPLSESDFQDSLKKGQQALGGYLNWYKYRWPKTIINEFNVRGVLLTPQVKLNGKIDKLELTPTSCEVRVVDYKTGQPKTRNHILGLTKSVGSGDYHRQLVFYKLLLDNFEPKKYQVVAGQLDFIEPDDQGRYHQEDFAITTDEVSELKALVLETTTQILSLRFLTKGCGRRECDYCRLWSLTH